MNFKEFFILSETLQPKELEKAWKDQSFLQRMMRRVMGRANFPASQGGNMSLPGRPYSNMSQYINDLMGADHWNELSISKRLNLIKRNGGDLEAAKDELHRVMLKVARGDYNPEQAADIVDNLLQRHVANSERDMKTHSRPDLGVLAAGSAKIALK